MGKKVKEFKSGDFIFAKVKGYPAWPARVQRLNGKKYFVYFYGTGETANLPPNMIFDYAENKDKFLTKTQKRRDFNDGVKQIEHDFANNVPLEDVIGVPIEVGAQALGDDTVNDSTADDTLNETAAADTTTANDTADDDTINAAQNDTAVDDSDETGALVIDEGKTSKGKKGKVDPKTPARETPKAAPKTPRGKPKKDDAKEKEDEAESNEELVSRSGRKIRPKRYIDEQTEENATLPSPAAKKRRGASPAASPAAEKEREREREKADPKDKNIKHFNAVTQSELEDLKEPFKQDADKENILMAYLPNGKYVGIKLFQSRPATFKNESSRLQWDKQAASNAITLKMQLERGHITALSVQGQLVMDLNLTDEEKATLDKERETEEKKFRVQFLKTEMKLIELDAKIKTCLSLEKADTDLCLKLLDELIALEVKPLMLLKHPTCLETIKRMRAYVGNTPSWDLSESAALVFSKQAHKIRKQADILYKNMKNLFTTPHGLSFWEYFSERVLVFKRVAAKLGASELLEMVHEPIEMSQPTSHTMKTAIDAANEEDGEPPKKKAALAKPKSKASVNNTPAKGKRQSARKAEEEKTDEPAQKEAEDTPNTSTEDKPAEEPPKEAQKPAEPNEDVEMAEAEPSKAAEEPANDKETEITQENSKGDKAKDKKAKNTKEGKKSPRNAEKNSKEVEKVTKEAESSSEKDPKGDEPSKDTDSPKDSEAVAKKSSKLEKSPKKDKNPIPESTSDAENGPEQQEKNSDGPQKGPEEVSSTQEEPDSSEDKVADAKNKKGDKNSDKSGDSEKGAKECGKETDSGKECEKRKADDKADDERQDSGEPRAKRSRESKKTEAPPPRSPVKRKSKH